MAPRRVLVTGAGGQLGHDLVVALSGEVPGGGLRGDARTGRLGDRPAADVVSAPREVLDVTRRADVLAAVSALRPQLVIHTAAFTERRRVREGPRPGVRCERTRDAPRRRGGTPLRGSPRCGVERLRLRRHGLAPVRRVGPDEAPFGLRACPSSLPSTRPERAPRSSAPRG